MSTRREAYEQIECKIPKKEEGVSSEQCSCCNNMGGVNASPAHIAIGLALSLNLKAWEIKMGRLPRSGDESLAASPFDPESDRR